MKKFFVLLIVGLFSFSIVAAEKARPWPRLTVWPDSVEVWIQNYDNQDYRCSGSVWIRYASGASRSEFISVSVYARSSAFRRLYNYNRQDRIVSATHTINCF